jgi:hypothetical protein
MPVSKHRRRRGAERGSGTGASTASSSTPPAPAPVADARVIAVETERGVLHYGIGPQTREKLSERHGDIEGAIHKLRSAIGRYCRRNEIKPDLAFDIGDHLGLCWGYACRGEDAMGAWVMLDLVAMTLGVARVRDEAIKERLDKLGDLIFGTFDEVEPQ